MATNLAAGVNDLATRVAQEVNTLRTEIASAGGGGSGNLDLPSYAPAGLTHQWEAKRSSYNNRSENMHLVRAKIAAVAANTASLHLGHLSDSTGVGYNGAIYDDSKSIPYRIMRALSRLTGNPYVTTGLTFAAMSTGSTAATFGNRWTLTGSWSGAGGMLTVTGAGTATLTTSEACTDIQVCYSNLSAAFSYKIDGGAAVNVIPNGTGTVAAFTASGLTYGIHTIVITFTNTSVIVAQRWWTTGLNQIHMHNLSFGGANANGGPTNAQNWSSTSAVNPYGLGYIAQQAMAAAGVTFDIASITIGSNDLYSGSHSADSVKIGIENMLGYIGTAKPFLVHEIPITGTDATQAALLGTHFFELADAHDCPLFDWNDYVGGNAGYNADGQAGADNLHPIFSHQNMIASWIAFELAQRQFVSEVYFPNMAGIPGGRYKLTEASGSYPRRPPVPAQYVDYSGADQPTDWLPGDSWDDLP